MTRSLLGPMLLVIMKKIYRNLLLARPRPLLGPRLLLVIVKKTWIVRKIYQNLLVPRPRFPPMADVTIKILRSMIRLSTIMKTTWIMKYQMKMRV